MLRLAAALALLATLVVPAAANAAKPRFIDAELISETLRPKPGGTALVGLRMVPKAGWHSYWTNPGEAGFPTVVEWEAPEGVHFGPVRHPAPSLIEVAGMASYVHEGPHVLVAQMSLDRDIPAGTSIPVTAEVSWAACSEKLCVPEKATLTLRLTAGDGANSAEAPLLRRAVAREPRPVGGGGFAVEGGKLLLELPKAARLNATKARFFPDENGIAEVAGSSLVSASPVRLTVPLAGDAPKVLTGVVTDGSSAYRLRLRLERTALTPEATTETAAAPAAEEPQETATAPAAEPLEPTVALLPRESGDNGRSGYLPLAVASFLAVLAGVAFLLFRRAKGTRA